MECLQTLKAFNLKPRPCVEDHGEGDMGQPETFVNFTTSTMKMFPADKYGVIYWNHGIGWHGFGGDQDPGLSLGRDNYTSPTFSARLFSSDTCCFAVTFVSETTQHIPHKQFMRKTLTPGGNHYDKYIDLDGLETTLKDSLAIAGVPKFDLIGFDACSMASTVVTSKIAKYGNVLLYSEDTEPGHGWNYEVVKDVVATPDLSPMVGWCSLEDPG